MSRPSSARTSRSSAASTSTFRKSSWKPYPTAHRGRGRVRTHASRTRHRRTSSGSRRLPRRYSLAAQPISRWTTNCGMPNYLTLVNVADDGAYVVNEGTEAFQIVPATVRNRSGHLPKGGRASFEGGDREACGGKIGPRFQWHTLARCPPTYPAVRTQRVARCTCRGHRLRWLPFTTWWRSRPARSTPPCCPRPQTAWPLPSIAVRCTKANTSGRSRTRSSSRSSAGRPPVPPLRSGSSVPAGCMA